MVRWLSNLFRRKKALAIGPLVRDMESAMGQGLPLQKRWLEEDISAHTLVAHLDQQAELLSDSIDYKRAAGIRHRAAAVACYALVLHKRAEEFGA